MNIVAFNKISNITSEVNRLRAATLANEIWTINLTYNAMDQTIAFFNEKLNGSISQDAGSLTTTPCISGYLLKHNHSSSNKSITTVRQEKSDHVEVNNVKMMTPYKKQSILKW